MDPTPRPRPRQDSVPPAGGAAGGPHFFSGGGLPPSRKEIRKSDVAILLAPLLVGVGASRLFAPAVYRQCGRRPALQPPGYVFAVAWTLLYALQGAAAAAAWRAGGRRWSPALAASAALLAGLFAGGVVFFNHACLKSAAFFSILLLLGASAAVAALYLAEGRRLSAALSLPLVAWLSFAAFLSGMAASPSIATRK